MLLNNEERTRNTSNSLIRHGLVPFVNAGAKNLYIQSKIRAQIVGKISWSDQDVHTKDLKSIQVVQNKMLRMMNGTHIVKILNIYTMLFVY